MMITISIKEAAELKSISIRSIQRYIKQGKIISVKTDGKNMIPISAFTETEQIRYYREHNIELPKELTKQKAKTVQRSTDLESYTADQREEMALWRKILEEWDTYLSSHDSRTEATKEFARIADEKYPEIKVSAGILYRKKRAFRDHGICGLVDLRGGHNKGSSSIPEVVWQAFLYYYLSERKDPVMKCIEYTQEWILDTNQTEFLPLPSPNTFYRHIESDITQALKILGRDGQKAFDDRCAPFIRREYKNMASNDWWVGDTHTLDIISDSGDVLHRLYIVAFMDVRSGIFVGWHVTLHPSSQATLVALRKAIMTHGIPKNVYVDNGREFLTRDVGGLGHRQKKSTKNDFTPPPVLERLGIHMTNAIVRNAKAKIIERRFLDIKNGLSRLFDTFTGGTVVERPEQLKYVVKGKKGTIPTDSEVINTIDELIEYYFNYEEYNGSVISDKGKLKINIYNENLKTKRVAEEKDLNLMLMRSSRKYKVGRRGVHLNIEGERIDYWNNEFVDNYGGKEVYYRWDPDDLSYIRVYDLDDRYIMTVPADNEAVLEYGASQQDVKTAMGKTGSLGKKVREELKQIKTLHGRKTALEMALRKAHSNQNIRIAPENPVIQIHRADEEPLRLAVGAADEKLVSVERMIRNRENKQK